MPKEWSHWLLARRAADRLEPGPLADAALAYDEHLLAGAVSHDSGYYDLGGPARMAADRLHGVGGYDSFAPFRALAARRDELGAPGFAFGLGALTHLAADVTFHPVVFSWTGDPDAFEPELRAGWMYRHQACETALDQHLEALWGAPSVRRFADLVRVGGRTLGRAHGVFSGMNSRRWVRAHARLQGLFQRPFAAWVARAAAWNHRGSDGDRSALFYRGPAQRHPAFEGSLEWVDPVTGGAQHATLEQLVERFEALMATLAPAWERAWTTGSVPFAGKVGLNLDTGLPCDRDQTKRHFLPRWF